MYDAVLYKSKRGINRMMHSDRVFGNKIILLFLLFFLQRTGACEHYALSRTGLRFRSIEKTVRHGYATNLNSYDCRDSHNCGTCVLFNGYAMALGYVIGVSFIITILLALIRDGGLV